MFILNKWELNAFSSVEFSAYPSRWAIPAIPDLLSGLRRIYKL